MRKWLLTFFCIAVFVIGGCTDKGVKDEATTENNIPFEPLWRGLSVTTEDHFPPFETFVFLDEETYQEFASTYFSWTDGEITNEVAAIDFSKEAIVYTAGGKARPFRAVSSEVIGYTIENNRIEPVFDDTEEVRGVIDIPESVSDELIDIYAIHLGIVKKEELPEQLDNVYRP